MDQLIQLIYVSSSQGLMDESELVELLTSIRVRNKQHNITGMLLYKGGNIMQLIEGAGSDVKQLFKNIQADSRHTGIIELIRQDISQRDFEEWSMSYKNVTDLNIEGVSDFMKIGAFPTKHSVTTSTAKKLLLSFRD